MRTSDPDNRSAACAALFGAALQMACVCAFTIAVFTARTPDGHVIPLVTAKTIVAMLKAIGILICGWIAALAVARDRHGFGRMAAAVSVFTPLYALFAYPLSMFVLFRLGCPYELLSLFVPPILVSASALLVLYRAALRADSSGRIRGLAFGYLDRLSPQVLAWALFVLFTAFYVGMTAQENRRKLVVGDEPHYMVIMQSLAQFGTADLAQIFRQQAMPDNLPLIQPHRSSESAKGKVYSIHHVGLPLLMLLPHIIGGFNGVMVFFNVVTSLVIVNVFLLCLQVLRRKLLSLATAILLGLSCPFVFYFRCIYPEMVAALFLLYACRQIQARETRILPILAAGIAAAMLPWLHVKFVLLSATLALLAIVAFWKTKTRLAIFLGPLLPSAVAMMCFFSSAYGSWLPTAPYGESSPVFSRFLLRGVPGLFFDRNHGVLAFAPFLAFSAVGWLAAVRSRQRDFLALALLAIPSYVVFASHWMWWGGPCPPGRFVIPILALLAPVTAMGIATARHPFWRSVLVLTIGAGLAVSATSLSAPGELASHTHILSHKLYSWSAFPCLPLFYLHRSDPLTSVNYVVLALWIVPLLLSLFCANRPAEAIATPPGRWAVTALTALLLWAGICSYARRVFDDKDGMTNERAASLVNVFIADFGGPVRRAGLSVQSPQLASARGARLASASIKIMRSPLRVRPLEYEKKDSSRYVVFRNIALCAACYTVTYHMETQGQPEGKKVGTVSVMRRGGGEPLAAADVPATGGDGLVPVRLDFIPDNASTQGEFYFTAIKGAKTRCDRVDIEVVVEDPDRKARARSVDQS